MCESVKRLNLYRRALQLVRRPPCWNSTARHARLDSLSTSNVSTRVETWRDEPSGIWAYRSTLRAEHHGIGVETERCIMGFADVFGHPPGSKTGVL